MKNKLVLAVLALASLTGTAQQLQDGDVMWPNSQKLAQFVKNWNPGQPVKIENPGDGATSVNPSASGIEYEDENFFISRVKLKPIIKRNVATQVVESYTDDDDKRLVNWVPINKANDGHTDALPNALFDSEVFSNWSYVSHWGDWIAPHGWVPAALADVAHKHGVLVSGVASIPYGSITSEAKDWKTPMDEMAGLSSAEQTKLAQFLYYHGVDGMAYNSEFNGYNESSMTNLQKVHKAVMAWFANKGQEFENIWYDGTTDTGTRQFDNGLAGHNDGNFSGSSLFWNYNWNNTARISNAITFAGNMQPARNSLYLYAGHNMQGGEPKGVNWTMLKQYPISIGLWGAHNTNMLWAQRNAKGSKPSAMQDTYQKRNEQWFTNGNRNPVKQQRIYDTTYFQPTDNFFGMSAYMTAKSTLGWDLSDEPFITFFNLGNGTFMNWKGERQHDTEWYNIGVQDYMPTWRWWFTSKFLGKDAADVPENGLDAQFTWDDAYMGGSCLQIFGSVDEEYLHLFKTDYEIQPGDVITVRYKLNSGKGNASIVFSTDENPKEAVEFALFDDKLESEDDWMVFKHEVSNRDDIAGNSIIVIALGFEDAVDLDLYIGEISIVRGTSTTPTAPKITKTKTLRNNMNGVDAKVIFNMENDKANGEPCYNSDVNTSLFKLYAQVNGQTKLMGLTSSWAGLLFRIPVGTAKTYKIGVSAVSEDFASESSITWSEDISTGEFTISEAVEVSQNVIKPNEPFTVGYADQNHAPAKWEISNANTGEVVKTEESATLVEFPNGLENIAPYNVKVTETGNNVREFDWLIQITDEAAGAVPKIYDMALNSGTNEVEIEPNDVVEASYTGRSADGSATRAVYADFNWIGGRWGDTGISGSTSFTVAGWINYTNPAVSGSSALFSIENRTVAWPQNNWGWFWSNLNANGTIGSFTFRTSNAGGSAEIKYTFSDTKITIGAWTHVAIVFDFKTTTQMRAQLYINGVKQNSTWTCASGSTQLRTQNGTTDDYVNYPNGVFSQDANQWFSFFGGRGEGAIYGDGYCDDIQLWNKALSEQEVKDAMYINSANIPDGLQCYWDFESDDNYNEDTGEFTSIGNIKTAKAGKFSMVSDKQTIGRPELVAGNPFLTGSAYQVVTKPTWSGKRAIITDATGSDTEGSATVTYKYVGDYTLTLTLENDYGSDSRTYPVITVGEDQGGEEPDPENPGTDPEDPNTDPEDPGQSGIADLNSDNLRTYTVNDVLYVEFATSGNYDVAVYNVNGSLVAQRADAAIAGQTMRINLGAAGVYVVRVSKDGGKAQGFKVLRK